MQHWHYRIEEILGDEAETETVSGRAMDPRPSRCRREWLHALREEAEDNPGKHIATPRSRELRRRIRIDRNPPIRRRYNGIGTSTPSRLAR